MKQLALIFILCLACSAQVMQQGIATSKPPAGAGGSCPSLPSPAPVSFWIVSGDTSGVSGCNSPTSSTTVYDLGGAGGNNGTWSGTAAGGVAGTYYSAATGRTATPYTGNFNGTDNYISFGAPTLGPPMSFSAWFKTSVTTDPTVIVDLRSGGGVGIIMYLDNTSGTPHQFRCYENNRGPSLSGSNNADGNWHFAACSYDTFNGTVRGYLDGVTLTPSATGSDGGATGGTQYIGRDATSSNFKFNGLINMVGVWNVVVTAGQFSTMYTSQAFMVIPELRPLARPYFSAEAITERQQFYGRKLAA